MTIFASSHQSRDEPLRTSPFPQIDTTQDGILGCVSGLIPVVVGKKGPISVIPVVRLAMLRGEINFSLFRRIRSVCVEEGSCAGGPYVLGPGTRRAWIFCWCLVSNAAARHQGPRLCTSSDRPLRSLSQLSYLSLSQYHSSRIAPHT